jgi:hypothetical protein
MNREDNMRPIKLAALTAAAAIAAVAVAALAASPAEAQTRKRAAVKRPAAVMVVGRAPTRLVVRRRSFLDPGTESLPFDQHYHDYAVGPGFTAYPRGFEHSVAPGTFSRMPLPGLWDVPGWVR